MMTVTSRYVTFALGGAIGACLTCTLPIARACGLPPAAGQTTFHCGGEPAEAPRFRAGILMAASQADLVLGAATASARQLSTAGQWALDGVEISGGDAHHYQAGVGLTLALPHGFDARLEGMPLGERTLSLGTGVSF